MPAAPTEPNLRSTLARRAALALATLALADPRPRRPRRWLHLLGERGHQHDRARQPRRRSEQRQPGVHRLRRRQRPRRGGGHRRKHLLDERRRQRPLARSGAPTWTVAASRTTSSTRARRSPRTPSRWRSTISTSTGRTPASSSASSGRRVSCPATRSTASGSTSATSPRTPSSPGSSTSPAGWRSAAAISTGRTMAGLPSTAQTIGRADLENGNVSNAAQLIPQPDGLVPSFGASGTAGLAVDANYIYWANAGTNAIARADLNATTVNLSFIPGASSPQGVAVDANYIYWANQGTDTIGRADHRRQSDQRQPELHQASGREPAPPASRSTRCPPPVPAPRRRSPARADPTRSRGPTATT